jgi:hypothetical protein
MISAKDLSVDHLIGELGRTQYGVVALDQLRARGVGRREIERRVRRGSLLGVAAGVYVINGSPPSTRQRMVIATVGASRRTALSHESAAELHRFHFVPRGRVVVTIGRAGQHRRPADRVHCKEDLRPVFCCAVDGLPTTTAERTLVDLASVLWPDRLERVLDDLLATDRVVYRDLIGVFNALARRGRNGIGRLRPLLEVRGEGYVAPSSTLEAGFVKLIDRFDLAQPTRQHLPPWAVADGIGRVDFAYPDRRLLIEVDGRRWHSRDQANEHDRFRDQQAVAAGWRVLRYTWTQVSERPRYVAKNLEATLALDVA